MTDSASTMGGAPAQIPAKPSLGVGSIIADSLGICLKRFAAVFVISLLPSAIGLFLYSQVIGVEAILGLAQPQFNDTAAGVAYALAVLGSLVVYYITIALLVQLAYDAKLQRPVRFGRYILPTLTAIVPIVLTGIAVTLLVVFASLALLVPGLWVYAVFSVTVPAIVKERIGFRGMARSASLTKEYRWPIAGLLLLVLLFTSGMSFAAQFFSSIAYDAGGLAGAIVFYLLVTTIATGLASLPLALIYARLREIKEGISVDQIASVFD
ncbi:hypothetical protein [Roseibium sp.]|uniref:hypothetical protein n=1 Tax=Roseibium sp. TaxID=1936156 RepID=UPI0039F0F56E